MRNRTILTAALALSTLIGGVSAAVPTTAAAEDTTLTFATAGDSLTIYPDTWWQQWNDPSIVKTSPGGYASSGKTSEQVLEALRPLVPLDADVLVLMLGTNDVRLGFTVAETLANLDAIVELVDAPSVLVTLTPPSDLTTTSCPTSCRTGQFVLNRAIQSHAAKRGWLAADPWSSYRAMSQGWTPGASDDGRHPTAEVGTAVRERMEVYIRQAAEGA